MTFSGICTWKKNGRTTKYTNLIFFHNVKLNVHWKKKKIGIFILYSSICFAQTFKFLLIWCEKYLIMITICIFSFTHDVEQRFICALTIQITCFPKLHLSMGLFIFYLLIWKSVCVCVCVCVCVLFLSQIDYLLQFSLSG
jgi:hypothetical protein